MNVLVGKVDGNGHRTSEREEEGKRREERGVVAVAVVQSMSFSL